MAIVTPEQAEIRRLNRILDGLDSERGSLYYRTADEVRRELNIPRDSFGQLSEALAKQWTKEVKARMAMEDRGLMNKQKLVRAEIKALKASTKRSPRTSRPSMPEIRIARCRPCDVQYQWYDRPDRRTLSTSEGRVWTNVACPQCGGELHQTTGRGRGYLAPPLPQI